MRQASQNQKVQMNQPKSAYGKQWRMAKEIATCRNRASNLFGVEYLALLSICVGLMAMPAMLVREISGWFGYRSRKFSIEVYAVAKPLLLGFVLFSGHATSFGWFIVTIYFLADLYLYLGGLVLLSRFYTAPASNPRSLLLLSINFVESLLAFAIFYGHTMSVAPQPPPGHEPVPTTDPMNLLYFSCVTAATVGYGDFTPITSAGKSIVLLQILSGLAFISIIIATFVSRVNDGESEDKAPGGSTVSVPPDEA